MTVRPNRIAAALFAGFGLMGLAHAQKAEVIHWWTSGGEAAAIKEMAAAYTKAGGTWVDTPIAGGGGHRRARASRARARPHPPRSSRRCSAHSRHPPSRRDHPCRRDADRGP